jgi:hypothetical protein
LLCIQLNELLGQLDPSAARCDVGHDCIADQLGLAQLAGLCSE